MSSSHAQYQDPSRSFRMTISKPMLHATETSSWLPCCRWRFSGDQPKKDTQPKVPTGDKASSTADKESSTGDNASLTGDKESSTGDNASSTGEKESSTGDKASSTGDKAPSTGEKASSSLNLGCQNLFYVPKVQASLRQLCIPMRAVRRNKVLKALADTPNEETLDSDPWLISACVILLKFSTICNFHDSHEGRSPCSMILIGTLNA